jgi:outer membrane receptor protein involved in Fe transport
MSAASIGTVRNESRRCGYSLLRRALVSAFGSALTASVFAQSAGPPAAAQIPAILVEGNRIQSPGLSPSGTNDYTITSENIAALPAGENSVLTDVLAQLPGVGIDQNQQVHIRNTEGSGFQYQINGVLIPLDINTNPPFISMINPLFIKRLDLLDGILPARYSYAAGGVVDIQTKDGCGQPGGSAALFAGQRATVQPSAQYAGCSGALGYYGSVPAAERSRARTAIHTGGGRRHPIGADRLLSQFS